jgi:ABC-type lipoprotein export system ATPase subunit
MQYTKENINKKTAAAERLLELCDKNIDVAVSTLYAASKASTRESPVYTPRNSDVMIRLNDISKRYKVGREHINALQHVNLEIYKGEFVAVTGTSGSGKSTLLHMVAGLDRPDSGTIEVSGQNIAKFRDNKLSRFRNRTIGFVFQFFYLQPFLNVQTNVEVPGMFARVKRSERMARSRELARLVGLGDRLQHLPRELSGGQMQRAAVARALQNNPPVLLADEPTGNLDRTNALAIFRMFKDIRDATQTTVVVVTHDIELASMADRVVHMADGALL